MEKAPVDAANPVTVRALIARNLRRLRLDATASHDDVVRTARYYGLGWTAQWVAAVERGQRAPTAEQLVALPMVLSEAFGHRVSLADLLLGDDPVVLGGAPGTAPVPVSGSYLREVLTAGVYRRPFRTPGTPFAALEGGDGALARAARKMRDISDAGLGDVDIRALAVAEAGAGDVEDKLARKLGVASIVVIAAAAALWGRSLTEERAARLSVDAAFREDRPGPKPAAVMRRLAAELSTRIEQAAARKAGSEPPAVAGSEPPAEAGEGTSPLRSGAPAPAGQPHTSGPGLPAAPTVQIVPVVPALTAESA
ncbi:MAG TPA: hypothetical protein VFB84_21905 [Micromonosporaceae bacterium]|nr:hypothetical protein [Micromonosporaceae bacterium]